jgi:predicted Fe-Mo cluster-binding NifX family protein
MKIWIPTADDRGIDSRLYDHFGRAPFLALADTESGAVDVIRNAEHRHDGGRCRPIEHVDVARADTVVCQGMGKRAVASLRKGGVDVWITSADTVGEAIAETRAGRLKKLTVDKACGGRGRRAHGQGHHGGRCADHER